MRIKKHSTGNQYLLVDDGIWIRNFTLNTIPLDINKLTNKSDYPLFFKNEINNDNSTTLAFDAETKKYNKAVIVSDGYKFSDKQSLLLDLPSDVIIIAVNRTLVKWNINKKIDLFLVNNPYSECMNYMPSHGYYPKCVASTRTNSEFIEIYKKRGGTVSTYSVSPEQGYHSPCKNWCFIDEYRNPICASIHLCYKLGVKKLLLMCCDDSFDTERPTAIKLENGLWTYPQHIKAQKIIEGMLFWYGKTKGVTIADHSSGIKYKNIAHIDSELIKKFYI